MESGKSGGELDNPSVVLLPPPRKSGSAAAQSSSVPLPTSTGYANPIMHLPPNTMQAPAETVSPRFLQPSLLASMKFPDEKPVEVAASPFKSILCCILLALILGGTLVGAGLAIAARQGKGDVKDLNPEATELEGIPSATGIQSATDIPSATDIQSATDVPSAKDIPSATEIPIAKDIPRATEIPSAKDIPEGYKADEEVFQDDREVVDADVVTLEGNTIKHSIDSYLTHLPIAQNAQAIRERGFEIKATSSPQPLLEQPYSVDVSSSNFKYNYVEAWFKSFLMFEVQRGGTQAPDSRTWRQNDATARDEARLGGTRQSMDGGWFEAGNHLKVTIPTAYTVTRLAWICEYYRPTLSKLHFSNDDTTSFGSAGSRTNKKLFGGKSAYEWCKREVHWGASWLRKATLISSEGTLEGIVIQCGLSVIDHHNVLNAEKIKGGSGERPCGVANDDRPATADAAQLAAALAAASRMFSHGTSTEQEMAKDWMMAAKKALQFATKHMEDKSWWRDDKLYPISMLADHVFYAEASIFLASVATNDSTSADEYFNDAMDSYGNSAALRQRCHSAVLVNWDSPCSLAMLMLVQGSGDYTSWFAIQLVREFVDANIGTEDPKAQHMVGRGDITITPTGARIFSAGSVDGQTWASLRSPGEAVSIASQVADFPGIDQISQTRYRCLTASQVNYILGDTGRSFVVGVGRNCEQDPPETIEGMPCFPLAPHTRDGFCALDMDEDDCTYVRWFEKTANSQIVVGAMVAGPTLSDQYSDDRENYESSEIAIDFQVAFISGLTGALAMPGEFWHEGSLSELKATCDAVGFKHYNWGKK